MKTHTKKRKRNKLNLHKTIKQHTLNKNIKLKKINCSPKPKNEVNNFSCYTTKSLYKLRDLWNARHPDVKIITNSPKEIHEQISNKLR